MPMHENRVVQNETASISPSDTIHGAIWRMKICDNPARSVAGSISYPARLGVPNCDHFLKTGLCAYGSNCCFNHPPHTFVGLASISELPQRVGQPDCRYYLKTGTCKYGPACKYHHPTDRNGAAPVNLNAMGLPLRQDQKPCDHYMRTGFCKFGAACKFHHPQPAFPMAGSVAGGALGSSVPSPSGLPYIGGLAAWSLPRTTYLPGTGVQGQQAYTPVFYSLNPGIVPTHDWSPYSGNVSGRSSVGFLGPGVYNSRNLNSLSTLPERPDKPECKYFMNSGSCKYGSDCKFHHPKEMVDRLANTVSYGPAAYPFYQPAGGYSGYHALTLPPLPMLMLPFPRPPTPHAMEINSSEVFEWIQKPEAPPDHHRESIGEAYGPPGLVPSETSPSSSSAVFEWIQKPGQPDHHHQESAGETYEDHRELASSSTHSSPV